LMKCILGKKEFVGWYYNRRISPDQVGHWSKTTIAATQAIATKNFCYYYVVHRCTDKQQKKVKRKSNRNGLSNNGMCAVNIKGSNCLTYWQKEWAPVVSERVNDKDAENTSTKLN
jgi:hypothetical protein